MKLKALLAAIFVAGLAASIAFAAPRDDGDHAKQHCKQVELKGTLAPGSFSLAVEKANKAGAALGSSVTVGYGGRVKVHARLCRDASSTGVLQLRELKVEHGPADTTTTTTPTTTTTTGH